jgi:hypothetical protein
MPGPIAIAPTSEKFRSIERVLDLTREALSHPGGIQTLVKPGQMVGVLVHLRRKAGHPGGLVEAGRRS